MRSALDQISDFCTPIHVDLQGWHSTAPIFKTLIDEVRPNVIVEVGSWKGASAIHMADLTRDLKSCIYCVDTWLGGVDHLLANESEQPKACDFIPRHDGYPQLYPQFLFNVRESGFGDRIFPLPQTSANGARYLAAKKIMSDLTYVDGSHEAADVMLDLVLYAKILAPKGVMFGDDWGFPGVEKSVRQFLDREKNWSGECDGNFWTLRRKT